MKKISWLDKHWARKICHSLKNVNFEKKSLKLKSVLYLLFTTVLDNYAFKIETSWAERVVKLLPETGNNNDLSIHVWLTYF